ncbi:MAG: lipopolysaccharide transport periplasmic protein LptA [Burkholderiaceae bacterium]
MPSRHSHAHLCLAAALALAAAGAAAEKADRNKPMTLESDKPCTVDLARQISVCSGNVLIAQGTLQIRADRIELRETPDGYRQALAIGSASAPAIYRQRRDGADEFVEGRADRVEYDTRGDTLRFVGNAVVKRSRAGAAGDEVSGSLIVWDNTAEVFTVQGGAASPGNPSGRVRAVLSPREPASAASAAGTELRPSPGLGDRR